MNVAEWIDIHNAGFRNRSTNGVDAANGRANQRSFQFHALADAVRREPSDVPTRPREEGRFVDRREIAHAFGVAADVFGGGVAIIGETFWKFFAKQIDVRGVAVVEQIPNDLDIVFATGFTEGAHRRKIVTTVALIHEWPADGFARGENPDFAQEPIVCVGMFVMIGGGHLVDPIAFGVVTGGAFKACKEKAAKHSSPFKYQFPVFPYCGVL